MGISIKQVLHLKIVLPLLMMHWFQCTGPFIDWGESSNYSAFYHFYNLTGSPEICSFKIKYFFCDLGFEQFVQDEGS